MNESDSWQVCNDRYLASALTWLRLRLTQFAEGNTVSHSESGTASLGKRFFSAPSTPSSSVNSAEVARSREAMNTAAAIDPPPALVILSRLFDLSEFEQAVLLLCVGMELDTRIADLCARAQDHPDRRYPTIALTLACFDHPAWNIFSPDRPLRYWNLIHIHQVGIQPFTVSPIRADDRIIHYSKGLNSLDNRLAALISPMAIGHDEVELPPSQQAAVEAIIHHLQYASWETQTVVQLVGSDSFSQQLVAHAAATLLGLNLYRLPVDFLPTQADELSTLSRLWLREMILLPNVLYLDATQIDLNNNSALTRFLAGNQGVFLLSTSDIRQELGQTSQVVEVHNPTPAEQTVLWSKALGAIAPHSPPLLATQFHLNPVTISSIAHRVLAEATKNKDAHHRIWAACLANTRPQLDSLAHRIEAKATWEELVLPAEEIAVLHQITEQVRQRHKVYLEWGFQRRMNRGLGISALFAGESGTGKTMAAEVIANDLQLNLYRIDLSAIVNKYIGETEKNLRRLFDAAEAGGAILFFDEADALFGKRSEVKDSHDRYANIEINYLLQRMESYRGLAILATNMKSALDTAFLRRLRFVVTFPFPAAKERKLLWQKAFPSETPLEAVNFDRLASLNLTGGNIHNIALNAAFLAAQADTPVTLPLLLAAARTEYRKLDRPINESDFRL